MPLTPPRSRAQQRVLAATLVWLLLVPTDLAFVIAVVCGAATVWLSQFKLVRGLP